MNKTLLLILIPFQLLAQNKPLDSLNNLFQNEKNSSIQLELISEMVDVTSSSDLLLATEYSRKGLALAQKTKNAKWTPKFHEMLGRNYANQLLNGVMQEQTQDGTATLFHFKIKAAA